MTNVTSHGPDGPDPSAVEPGPVACGEEHVDARAVKERHVPEVEGKPRPVPARHAEQLIAQLRRGTDVQFPADRDDRRGTGPDAHPQARWSEQVPRWPVREARRR